MIYVTLLLCIVLVVSAAFDAGWRPWRRVAATICIAPLALGSCANISPAWAYERETLTEYQKVRNGEMQISQAPRAVKRRALAACKNKGMFKLIQEAVPSIDSVKTCTQRVIIDNDGSDIVPSINKVISNLPPDELQALMKKYGDQP